MQNIVKGNVSEKGDEDMKKNGILDKRKKLLMAVEFFCVAKNELNQVCQELDLLEEHHLEEEKKLVATSRYLSEVQTGFLDNCERCSRVEGLEESILRAIPSLFEMERLICESESRYDAAIKKYRTAKETLFSLSREYEKSVDEDGVLCSMEDQKAEVSDFLLFSKGGPSGGES
jgi:hypothetical protein